MVDLKNIHALTDFLRNHKKHVNRLRRARTPEVLTINGKAALVVQDAGSYQELLDKIERAEALAGIRRGLESMLRGKGRPATEFFEEMKRKHKLPD